MNRSEEIVIIGGGVIGCSVAYSLGKRGVRSLILEKGAAGQEASSSAAGMLGAQVETHAPGPFVDLCVASRQMYRNFAEELLGLTGIPLQYNDAGILRIALTEADRKELLVRKQWQQELGETAEWLSMEDCRELEPALSSDILGGLHFSNDHQVNNRQLARALASAVRNQGSTLLEGTEVYEILVENDRVAGVKTNEGTIYASQVIIAGGAWSTKLLANLGVNLPVYPVKGQSYAVEAFPMPFKHTLFTDGAYLVPKSDGSIIVGATEEEAGFCKKVSLNAIAGIDEVACRLVPALKKASLVRTWAGLRPATPDKLPYLGAIKSIKGLTAATGHFRNGILLTPITGELIADSLTGKTPMLDVTPFSPMRVIEGDRQR